MNKMDGVNSPLIASDKALICYLTLEWLGVGFAQMGFVIGLLINGHR